MRLMQGLGAAMLVLLGCREAGVDPVIPVIDPFWDCDDGIPRETYLADHLETYCTWLVSCPDLNHVSVDTCVASYTDRFLTLDWGGVTDDGEPCWHECRAAVCVEELAEPPTCTSSAQAAHGTQISLCEGLRQCRPQRRE